MADMFMGRPIKYTDEVKGPEGIEFGNLDKFVVRTCNLPVEQSDSAEGPWERVEPGYPITKRYLRGIINEETNGKTAQINTNPELDKMWKFYKTELGKMWEFHKSEMKKMWDFHHEMMGEQKAHYERMQNSDRWFGWYLFGVGIFIGAAVVAIFFVK